MAKQFTKFGYLMNLLHISITELGNAINIERTSISKWKTGSRRLPVEQPYFEKIIDYFILKNETLGTDLLEDFFESMFPRKKRTKDYLRKCIRNYILNIPDRRGAEDIEESDDLFVSYHTTYLGVEGRRNALLALFRRAEKMTTPVKITLLEYDDFQWVGGDMEFFLLFFHCLNKLLHMGHNVELIMYVGNNGVPNYELHRNFLQVCQHDNIKLYFLPTRFAKKYGTSLYGIEQKLIVMGYNGMDDISQMTSFLSQDKVLVNAQYRLINNLKEASCPSQVIEKFEDAQKMKSIFEHSSQKMNDYYHLAPFLSFVTMSEELMHEVLDQNKATPFQRQMCCEAYQLFRKNVESSDPDSMSGFYYMLDHLKALLSYETAIHYSMSSITGMVVKTSRAQNLRHFHDSAEMLLKDKRYKIVLHNSPISGLLWIKDGSWCLRVKPGNFGCKSKYTFTDDVRVIESLKITFHTLYDSTTRINTNSEYIADLFMKISRGEYPAGLV